jgi:hypothetical protein
MATGYEVCKQMSSQPTPFHQATNLLMPHGVKMRLLTLMSRTLVAATLITSVLVHTELIPFYYVAYLQKLILQMPPKWPQIWRVLTPFLITGPKFGILMDPYFCMLALEVDEDVKMDRKLTRRVISVHIRQRSRTGLAQVHGAGEFLRVCRVRHGVHRCK